jgi:hypothetical protein
MIEMTVREQNGARRTTKARPRDPLDPARKARQPGIDENPRRMRFADEVAVDEERRQADDSRSNFPLRVFRRLQLLQRR